MNGAIPTAADVPGLRDYLAGPYRQSPSTALPPTVPLTVTGLVVAPNPVKTTGTVSFDVSAPAAVTVRIVTTKGALVRTLLAASPESAGLVAARWDRTDANGRKVRRGTYGARVDAVDGTGRTSSASTSFSVY
jgi:flagellar hook assembly protein FlgD